MGKGTCFFFFPFRLNLSSTPDRRCYFGTANYKYDTNKQTKFNKETNRHTYKKAHHVSGLINAKSFSQIIENKWAVCLELVLAGKDIPERGKNIYIYQVTITNCKGTGTTHTNAYPRSSMHTSVWTVGVVGDGYDM